MKLAVTIDVEEEGLFSGSYAGGPATATNVDRLEMLDPVFRAKGIRPTLLVSYQVLQHERHRRLVRQLARAWHGEIGAHLHPWNTPPRGEWRQPEPVHSDAIPREVLEAKLTTLMAAFGQDHPRPRSFRMGRYNMGPRLLSLLEAHGFTVDSSVAPLRSYYPGVGHLRAPCDPYFPDRSDVTRPGASTVLEVPLTIRSVLPAAGRVLAQANTMGMLSDRRALWVAKHASLPCQPLWTGLRRIQAAVLVHRLLLGKLVTLSFHSSELLPGGHPKHQTEDDVKEFIHKLDRLFDWLSASMGGESITLAQARSLFGGPQSAGAEEKP